MVLAPWGVLTAGFSGSAGRPHGELAWPVQKRPERLVVAAESGETGAGEGGPGHAPGSGSAGQGGWGPAWPCEAAAALTGGDRPPDPGRSTCGHHWMPSPHHADTGLGLPPGWRCPLKPGGAGRVSCSCSQLGPRPWPSPLPYPPGPRKLKPAQAQAQGQACSPSFWSPGGRPGHHGTPHPQRTQRASRGAGGSPRARVRARPSSQGQPPRPPLNPYLSGAPALHPRSSAHRGSGRSW